MLKEIYIENYKSLKNTTVQFQNGLNIIIGPNGSGKSNLLEFIDNSVNFFVVLGTKKNFKLGDNYSYTFDIGETESNYMKITIKTQIENNLLREANGSDYSRKITKLLDVEYGPNPISVSNYDISDNSFSNLPNEERLRMLNYVCIEQLIKYSIPDKLIWLQSPKKYIIEPDVFSSLSNEDENLVFTIKFRDHIDYKINAFYEGDLYDSALLRKFILIIFEDYKYELNLDQNLNLTSPIEKVRINPNINIYNIDKKILIDNLTFEFKINDTWVPWSYLSDGTKRLFYIIAEISSQKDGLILIEEPELGIHPHQLFNLMTFIKEESYNKQIIISTHSPIVLDVLEPDELDRITIAKIEKGTSQFHKLTKEQKEKAKEYMIEVSDLSYYWLHSDLESND